MKIGQLTEYDKRNIKKIIQKMGQGDKIQTYFYFLKMLNIR